MVLRAVEANIPDMGAAGVLAGKSTHQLVAHIRVEEQFHATEFARRRSRVAAKANEARISSRVRSGKSLRISSSLIPPARYSSTSYTVMRVPLTHGFPPRTAGFTETRSCQFIRRILHRRRVYSRRAY